MKRTLLEMTQDILSSMDSDEVNSITDTVEAAQVATIIKNTYFDIIERSNLPEHYTLINLQASGSSTKPVLMSVPDTVEDILWIKYNVETDDETHMQFKDIEYLSLEDFLLRMHQQNEDDSEVLVMTLTSGSNSIDFLYKNDKAPSYWTSFDDTQIVFDSYDAEVDSTLQASKTICLGKKVITWTSSNSFIPDLDSAHFPLLFNEAKATAWVELKQSQNAKAEIASRRQWTHLQKSKYKAKEPQYFESLPNFGRK